MAEKPTYEELEKRVQELEQSKYDHELMTEKLRASEERFRTIIEQSPSAIEIYDPNGKLLIVNDAWESLWNMKKSDTANFNIFIDPECERTGLTSAFKKVLRDIECSIPPVKYYPKESGFPEGSIRWINPKMYPIKDQYGEIKNIVLVLEDITERKQAEEALKKAHNELELKVKERTIELNNKLQQRKQMEKILRGNEEKYRLLFETVIHGIQEIDASGEILSANSACHMMLGYKKGELKGRSMFEFIANSNQRKELHDNIQLLVQQKSKPKTWFGKIKKKNGDVFDGQTDWNYKRDIHGEVIGFIFVLSDVTERKLAEAVLKYSKLQMESVFNNLGASIYITDMDSHEILFINSHMKELFEKDLTGQICWKSIHENQDGPCEFCTNDKLIDDDGKSTGPYIWKIYNQQLNKWYELHDQAIPWSDGKLVRMEIAFDITEREQAEKEKKALQEELMKARKIESIGTLAGGIAHDFNNLLYVVMGNISLAQDDLNLEIETSENLKEAEKACTMAKELTAQLITFSKGGDPVREIHSIYDLLKTMVAAALSGSDINQEIFIADDIKQVIIDEGQIKQVVRNIVANAREAMEDKGQLKVSCENFDIAEKGYLTLNQGEYIKISFTDQGCGILKENFEKIFDPYFSTKDLGVDKGQGLGLTVSYSIIQKHGGLITVESELQIGSTFSIYLPAFLVKEPDLQKSEEKPTAQEPVKKPAKGTGKILLMDDEKAIRTFLGQIINRLGYDVETCIEGKEAIEIYTKAMESKEPFDVVILDLTNKIGMGGQQTMKRLLELHSDVKGIIITGYSDDPAVANFRAYGFSGFIIKPATRSELRKVIKEVCSIGQ